MRLLCFLLFAALLALGTCAEGDVDDATSFESAPTIEYMGTVDVEISNPPHTSICVLDSRGECVSWATILSPRH